MLPLTRNKNELGLTFQGTVMSLTLVLCHNYQNNLYAS